MCPPPPGQYRRGYDGPRSWMGSLIYESRDHSGLYYRRNRFYDAETGRFTQEDPIGLFSTRMGVEREDAARLLEQIHALITRMEQL